MTKRHTVLWIVTWGEYVEEFSSFGGQREATYRTWTNREEARLFASTMRDKAKQGDVIRAVCGPRPLKYADEK